MFWTIPITGGGSGTVRRSATKYEPCGIAATRIPSLRSWLSFQNWILATRTDLDSLLVTYRIRTLLYNLREGVELAAPAVTLPRVAATLIKTGTVQIGAQTRQTQMGTLMITSTFSVRSSERASLRVIGLVAVYLLKRIAAVGGQIQVTVYPARPKSP